MKWKFLNVPLGASAPYGNSRKCVGEDAIVGLGTSVLSGLFGMMNTDNTNAANRAMAHETNQYNYSINMANRELQRDMFYQQLAESRLQREQDRNWYLQDIADERAYNDPSAIAARLRAAGINPALAMQSGQLGHSGGSGVMSNPGTSVPSFQAPQTIPMQNGAPMIPYDGFGLMAQNIGNILLASKKQEADIAALRAQTQLNAMDTFSKVIQRGFENGKIKADMNKVLQDFQFNQRNMVELDRSVKLANDKIYADQQYQEALTEGARFANSIAPEMHEFNRQKFASDFAVAAATIAELDSRSDLNEQQKELVGKHIVEQDLINKDLPKKLHNENTILVQTYNKVKADARRLRFAGDTEYWNSMDARKTYRSHIGSNRPIDEYIEEALRNSQRIKVK